MKDVMTTRVVAGIYRSRKLYAISNEVTRPTTDKNKEMIFNTLGQFFDGGVALDLFAGTGSLGIEAISRGVSSCYFSEINPDTFEILKKNIQSLGIQNATLFKGDFRDFLIKFQTQKFDLVMIDPPYRIADEIPWALDYMNKKKMFHNGCLILLELPKESSYLPQGFTYLKEKTGAASRFVFLKYEGEKI